MPHPKPRPPLRPAPPHHAPLARAAAWLVVVACLGAALGQSAWQETFREDFGPNAHPLYAFGGVITFGPQPGDPWTALLRDGRLEISNATDPSVIRYYFLEPRHVPGWTAAGGALPRASVRVGGTFDTFPGAGLVYGLDPSTHYFVALVLTGGDGYGVYVLDGQGYRAVATGTAPGIDQGGLTELTIAPEGSVLGFYVAGQRVFEGPLTGGIGVGLVAAGTGRFAFDAFVLSLPR